MDQANEGIKQTSERIDQLTEMINKENNRTNQETTVNSPKWKKHLPALLVSIVATIVATIIGGVLVGWILDYPRTRGNGVEYRINEPLFQIGSNASGDTHVLEELPYEEALETSKSRQINNDIDNTSSKEKKYILTSKDHIFTIPGTISNENSNGILIEEITLEVDFEEKLEIDLMKDAKKRNKAVHTDGVPSFFFETTLTEDVNECQLVGFTNSNFERIPIDNPNQYSIDPNTYAEIDIKVVDNDFVEHGIYKFSINLKYREGPDTYTKRIDSDRLNVYLLCLDTESQK